MNQKVQWILAGLLVVVIILQIKVMSKMPAEADVPSLNQIDQQIRKWTMQNGAMFSANNRSVTESVLASTSRLPSLEDIDQRIKHWTMHHCTVFSANSRVATLERELNKRFDSIDKRLSKISGTENP